MTEKIAYTMNITKQFHKELKLKATIKGMNIKDYIISLVANDNKEYDKNFFKDLDKEAKDYKNLPHYKTTEELFNSMEITNYK